MFTKLREPLGTAGLIVAIIALVLALGGGAWAITASTGAKHHNLKAKRHARGIRGPQGPQGSEGPEGPPGVNGKNGVNGKPGLNGTNGTPGKSVASGEEPPGENCPEGGYWFEIQGTGNKQYVCNGGGGSGGGSTEQTVLAPGETEKGNYAFANGGNSRYIVTIDFPLHVPREGTQRFIKPGDPPTTECPGTEAQPAAAPGYLCIYVSVTVNGIVSSSAGWTRDPLSGAALVVTPVEAGKEMFGQGSWALTACTAEEPICP